MKKISTFLVLMVLVMGAFAQNNPVEMKKVAQKWLSRVTHLKTATHPVPYARLKSTAGVSTLDSIVFDLGTKKVFTYNAEGLVTNVDIYTDFYQDGSSLITESHTLKYDGNGNITHYLVQKSDNEGSIDFYEMTSTYDAKNRLISQIISDMSQGDFQLVSKTVNTYGETDRTDNYKYNPDLDEGWELTDYVVTYYKEGQLIDYQEGWEMDEDTGEEVFTRFTYKDYTHNQPALIVGEQLDVATQEWNELMRTDFVYDAKGNTTSELMTINFFGSLIPMVQSTFAYDEKGRTISQGSSMLDFASGEMVLYLLVETIMENNKVKSVVWKEKDKVTNEMVATKIWEFDMATTSEQTLIPFNYNYTDINLEETNDFLDAELFADARIKSITYGTTESFMGNKQSYVAIYYYSGSNSDDDGDDNGDDDGGNTGGDDDSGDTGGDNGGNDNGNTGGDTGNTGGDTGNTDGDTEGNTGGDDTGNTNSINQNALPFEITFGPNPVKDQLNIQTMGSSCYKLVIRDNTGKVCGQKTLTGNATLSIGNYAKGVYVAEIKSGTTLLKRIKFMKE
jgi:hypothetical protein